MIEIMETIDKIGEQLIDTGTDMLWYVTVPILLFLVLVYLVTRDRKR